MHIFWLNISYVYIATLLMIVASGERNASYFEERDKGVQHFKLGLLAPWKTAYQDFSALTSASAVSIAIEKIHADPTLGSWMRFSVVTQDTSCNSKISASNTVKLFIEEDIDAYIGPACSDALRPAAELASYWNKPIISWVGTNPEFNDKNTYTTLGRTLGPFNKMAVFMLEVFKQYEWKRVVMISSNYFLWLDARTAIRTVFRENNVTIAFESDFERYPPESYIEKTLLKTKEEGRIVILVVPKEDRRRFMLKAHDLQMTKGDYVFYTIEMLPEENVLSPEDVWSGNDGRDTEAKQAFEAVFHVTLAALTNKEVNAFRNEVARRMRLPPWSQYVSSTIDMTNFKNGDKYSPFLHDTVLLYAIALNETKTNGGDIRSGVSVAANMRSKTFRGITGFLVLDSNGDREPDYWITDMVPNGSFIRIAEVLNRDTSREFRKDVNPPRWPGGKVGHEHAPPDTPICGFRNELCKEEAVAGWIIALAVVLALIAIAAATGMGVYLYRKGRFETELLLQAWKVSWDDVEPLRNGSKKGGGSTPTISSASHSASGSRTSGLDGSKRIGGVEVKDSSKSSQTRSVPSVGTTGTGGGQIFSDIGLYKGVLVALKHIKKEHMTITRNVMLEFNELKDMVHENLNVFAGACVDPPNICILWHYCAKGSLLDVLENDGYKLDNVFKLSFMMDIASGMQYLHSSTIGSHGNLKDSNCLIDGRWALKITDYGLPSFLSGQDFQLEEQDQYKRKLWTAPEILRENFPPPKGTQKADVYSFAIIAYEIMMRSDPYSFDSMTPRDVVNRVRNGESIPFRPHLPDSTDLGRAMVELIKSCWAENLDTRPNFAQIKGSLRKMNKGNINITDNVLKMMEKYAYNLEEIVEERTQQLIEEKKKTDRLLYRMLPSTVAEQLKAGRFVQPENYDQATIYFSDIVGFTQMASESSPLQIVDFLNDLYVAFDDVIAKHNVYKVETIGDAYMVASGVPVRNGTRHVAEIANVALELLSEVTHFKIRHRPKEQLKLRVGLHTGPVVAGVVGLIMPRYCLFGDTINMAARMESSGKALRIHISKATYILLKEISNDYEITLRGEMNVKGKGLQVTYWLHGRKGFEKPLPTFEQSSVHEDKEMEDADSQPRHALMQSYDSFPTANNQGAMPQVV